MLKANDICSLLTIITYMFYRSKKNREELTRFQSVDQRFEMANLERVPSNSNKEGHPIRSANTVEAQGGYFVLDPSVTKYDKDLRNRELPEVKKL